MSKTDDYENDDPHGDRYYLIKNGYYYRPNSRGYTSSPLEAGMFGERYAKDHCANTEGVTMELVV